MDQFSPFNGPIPSFNFMVTHFLTAGVHQIHPHQKKYILCLWCITFWDNIFIFFIFKSKYHLMFFRMDDLKLFYIWDLFIWELYFYFIFKSFKGWYNRMRMDDNRMKYIICLLTIRSEIRKIFIRRRTLAFNSAGYDP